MFKIFKYRLNRISICSVLYIIINVETRHCLPPSGLEGGLLYKEIKIFYIPNIQETQYAASLH